VRRRHSIERTKGISSELNQVVDYDRVCRIE
jgi:hypothetical protein